jgi:hypothetical protein
MEGREKTHNDANNLIFSIMRERKLFRSKNFFLSRADDMPNGNKYDDDFLLFEKVFKYFST